MRKTLNRYIALFDYFNKFLIVLSTTSSSISIALFATIIGAPAVTGSASLNLEFSIPTVLVKKLWRTTRNKKKKHNKIVMLARSKLNSIESKISSAVVDNEISHKDFTTIINKEKNYRELKKSIRMMKTKRSCTEKI